MNSQPLIFVRHAHAEWTPHENRPLSPHGARDAIRVAEMLASIDIARIYSSPYQRAYQTVEPLSKLKDRKIHVDERFRERDLGAWEAKSFNEAIRKTWEDFNFAFPNGETNNAAQVRGVAATQEILAQGCSGPVVISTHGNLLTLILEHYNPDLGYTFWQTLTMPDIYQLEWNQEDQINLSRLWGRTIAQNNNR